MLFSFSNWLNPDFAVKKRWFFPKKELDYSPKNLKKLRNITTKAEIKMTVNISMEDLILKHITDSMSNALEADRYAHWKLNCPELTDVDFVRLGVLRCLAKVDSGRHFLQDMAQVAEEQWAHSTYFQALHSRRRLEMVKALSIQSKLLYDLKMESMNIDYLAQFPELDDYDVEAADGHFVDNACHTEKNDSGKVFAAGFIYALNLRNALLRALCVVTKGTKKSHEIPSFRKYIEQQNESGVRKRKHISVYDKAITDYRWWDKQKSMGYYMISLLKTNAVVEHVDAITFDTESELNTGVEEYGIYKKEGATFSIVRYRDPETLKLHTFITTLPATINPGVIAMLYFKRWTIEKVFNNSKSNMKEKKAWSEDLKSLNIQMRFTAMAYNQLRVLEEESKYNNPELTHPSDIKYQDVLNKRDKEARTKNCFVNPLHFKKRITRLSSFTIRTIQNAIIKGMSYKAVMNELTSKLLYAPSLQ